MDDKQSGCPTIFLMDAGNGLDVIEKMKCRSILDLEERRFYNGFQKEIRLPIK